MNDNSTFNPSEYYKSYPRKVILRPGYPARAQFKSTLLYSLYGDLLHRELDEIKEYADIGGCFGFGAHAMAYKISKDQSAYPRTTVFEISQEFVTTGRILFPHINFFFGELEKWSGDPKVFDLVTLFDVLEHIQNVKGFLQILASRTKFALLKTLWEKENGADQGFQLHKENSILMDT